MKVSELQSKIDILEAENKLLKESCSNKQNLLEAVLEHNSVLIMEKAKHVVQPNDKQVNLNKSTCGSQSHMGVNPNPTKKSLNIQKLSTMSEIIAKKPQTDRSNNDAKANKDSIIILGGSMIKHVNGRNISRSHTVKVCSNPGASSHDLMDYVKPAMRKKRKALVIQTGTKDIQQEMNTMKMVNKLFTVMKEIDLKKKLKLSFLV